MLNLFVFNVSFFALKIQETGDPLGAEEDHAPASWEEDHAPTSWL
jgi:hypothetical protein